MPRAKDLSVVVLTATVPSAALGRRVTLDLFFPPTGVSDRPPRLLLINDGQDLATLRLAQVLEGWYATGRIGSLFCVGIHAGADRKKEYGTAHASDYKGRGNKAPAYTRFVTEELPAFLQAHWPALTTGPVAIAGFSLGGLSALDIAWNRPGFDAVGVFSGSFWWRSLGQDDEGYDDALHRIMHARIRATPARQGLRFFFECGTLDETADRNGNGIIDSIDDTRDLIDCLEAKGYQAHRDIHYLELEGGRHDIATWSIAMPVFIRWLFE